MRAEDEGHVCGKQGFGRGADGINDCCPSCAPASPPSPAAAPKFHAGHAIALHMVIELAREAKLTGDAQADANIRNSLIRAREVQQWLEPPVHGLVWPSAIDADLLRQSLVYTAELESQVRTLQEENEAMRRETVGVDCLAGAVCALVDRGVIDARSMAADALLNFASAKYGDQNPITCVRSAYEAILDKGRAALSSKTETAE